MSCERDRVIKRLIRRLFQYPGLYMRTNGLQENMNSLLQPVISTRHIPYVSEKKSVS